MCKIHIWPPVLLLMMPIVATGATFEVANVMAQQRPANKLVDIYYDLNAPDGGRFNVSIQITSDKSTPPLDTLTGDVGFDVTPGKCRHIVWDAGKDWPGNVDSNMVAVVAAQQSTPSKGMVWIPPGINEGYDDYLAEYNGGEYRLVNEKGFWMDRTEVTYNMWVSVYDWACNHGYTFSGRIPDNATEKDIYADYWSTTQMWGGKDFECWVSDSRYSSAKRITCHEYRGTGFYEAYYEHVYVKNLPVCNISIDDALRWCNARSEKEGLNPVYWLDEGTNSVIYGLQTNLQSISRVVVKNFPDRNGYQLPSYNEWAYAARGGVRGKIYPWGDNRDYSKANIPNDMGQYHPKCIVSACASDPWYTSEEEKWHPHDPDISGVDTWCYKKYTSSGWQIVWRGDCELSYEAMKDDGWSLIEWGHTSGYDIPDEQIRPISIKIYRAAGYSFVGYRKCSYLRGFTEKYNNYAGMPVASFPPNGYGLYDIVGNVSELSVQIRDGKCDSYCTGLGGCVAGGGPIGFQGGLGHWWRWLAGYYGTFDVPGVRCILK